MSVFETVDADLSKRCKAARVLMNSAGSKAKKPKGEKGE